MAGACAYGISGSREDLENWIKKRKNVKQISGKRDLKQVKLCTTSFAKENPNK